MYEEIIKALHYAISFDFGVCIDIFDEYLLETSEIFLIVLGLRIGAWALKQFADY